MKKFLIVIFFLSITAHAQHSIERTVDTLFSRWDSNSSPGGVITVIRKGNVIVSKAYGSACLEHQAPNSTKTVFRAASLSKQFTAFCIAILIHEGRLSLNDPVTKYVPQLSTHVYGSIQIQHLIHHTSGIQEYADLQLLRGVADTAHATNDEIIELLACQNSLCFKPGTNFSYCNSGYVLLAEIIRNITGESLAEFSNERIFKPLGMQDTFFFDNANMTIADRAYGYAQLLSSGKFILLDTQYEVIGDGGLFISARDMIQWNKVLSGYHFDKGVYELFYTLGSLNNGRKFNYMFGMQNGTYRGYRIHSHGGAFVGFKCQYIRFPDLDLAVICLMNTTSSNPSKICFALADYLLFDENVHTYPEPLPQQFNQSTDKSLPALSRDLEGIYYCEELKTIHVIRVEGEGAFLYLNGFSKAKLQSEGSNTFSLFGIFAIHFDADKGKTFSGYTCKSNSIGAVRFRRIQ